MEIYLFSCNCSLQIIRFYQRFLYNKMSSPAPEEQQTLQFYKIQIMQKDREIADFTAKMKKTQFKHTRELKQQKLNKERFENLLKDQKVKSDKFSKLAQENKEQNQMLELRLLELKREKERQVSEIQSKYNTLKEEVRSYERILPTFTFLSQIGQTIGELPNYEDIYFNLKSKTSQYDDLLSIHKQAQQKWQETMKSMKSNEQNLKNKRNEAEKHLKELISKFQESQYLICDLKINNEELTDKITQFEQQLQFCQQRCQSLQNSVKEYEQKIQKLAQNFQNDLILKEQQVRKAYQLQMIQLEEELRSQQSQFQRKEAMLNEQIRLLEQEMVYSSNKYQAEIQTFQQHYQSIKQETERMKNQILQQKRRYDELQELFRDSQQGRIQISKINQVVEEKNKVLQHKIITYEHLAAKETRKRQLNQSNSIKELQKNYEDLLQRMNMINTQLVNVQEQRDHLQQQNFLLRQQISSKEFEHNQSKSFLFDLSKAVENFEDKMRKKSMQVQNTIQKKESNTLAIGRDRRNSFYEDNSRVKELQKEKLLLNEKCLEIQRKMKDVQTQNQKLKNEIDQQKRQKQITMKQNTSLKEKIISLNKLNNDHQKTVHNNSTKNTIQKTKIDSLQEQLKLTSDENKRQKETIKRLKEQLKLLKETNYLQSENLRKQIKDFSVQLQSIKVQREKLKCEVANKEKLLNHESSLLKNSKQLQQKLKEQIESLKRQNKSFDLSVQSLQNKQSKHQAKIHELQKEIDKLEAALKQSAKELQRTNQSLLRQRKERSLLTVPSLHFINQQDKEEAFKQIYASIPQKQGEINILQRQILDLKQQIQTIKITHSAKLQAMESQTNEYVQTIIQMKMRCAQSQMKASQKEYLYMQLKKKMSTLKP